MFSQTSSGLVTSPSALNHHLGITADHPELVAAKDLYYETGQKSLVLIMDLDEDGNLPVVRISANPTPGFLDSESYNTVIGRLMQNAKQPITDRETFSTALYNLLLRYVAPSDFVSGDAPKGVFLKACFDLLFAYTPSTYCIAATLMKSLDQTSTQVRYSKIAALD